MDRKRTAFVGSWIVMMTMVGVVTCQKKSPASSQDSVPVTCSHHAGYHCEIFEDRFEGTFPVLKDVNCKDDGYRGDKTAFASARCYFGNDEIWMDAVDIGDGVYECVHGFHRIMFERTPEKVSSIEGDNAYSTDCPYQESRRDE